MNFFYLLFFLLFFISCSKDKDNLVDLNSFLSQGKKIELTTESNLDQKDILNLKSLKLKKNINYKNWTQSNYNSNNLIFQSGVNLQKKINSISGKFQKMLFYKNKIFVIDDKSKIQVFDQNLKKIISKKIYNRKIYKKYNLKFDIAINQNILLISDNLGNIQALNSSSLKKIWSLELKVPFRSNIKIYDNKIFIMNTNSKIFSINLKKGDINWSFETTSKSLKHSNSYQISIFADKLFFTNDSAEIFCIDLKTRNVIWTLVFSSENFKKSPIIFKSSPIIIDQNNNLFVSTNYGFLYSINSNNGFLNWSKPLKSNNNLILTEKYIFSSSSDRIKILNKETGDILFNKNISILYNKNKNFSLEKIHIGKSNIYLFSQDGTISLIKISNLKSINFLKPAKNFKDYIVANDHLYLLTLNSIIKF